MFTVLLPGAEFYDEQKEEFITQTPIQLDFEHSLVSLSKWESKFEKPFLSTTEKTPEEIAYYLEAMLQTPNAPPDVIQRLTKDDLSALTAYIDSKMTATWFRETPTAPNREIITSELIYYWMISLNIPLDMEHWHLNRLFTLIRVFNVKNAPPKKMSKSELAARNRKLNEQRRNQLGSRG